MLVSLNKGTVAMLLSPTNPPGIQLYSYANALLFWLKNILFDHMSENAPVLKAKRIFLNYENMLAVQI